MRKIICLTFLALPFAAMAGVCETAWDGDKIISSLSGRSSELRIPLKNQNQATNEITLGQLQVFHEAKDRISQVVGVSPKFVVCGDREPNAFAFSGSSGEVVAVSIGMLNIANGDRDMAAAVIGHEFAHHIKQHGANSQVRETVLGVLGLIAGVALEYNLQKKHGIQNLGLDLGQTGAALTSRKFDRDQEREADDLGFQYMLSAGYNPEGAVRFWERMSRLGGGGGGWFYDTHPGTNERTELFKTKIANSPQAQQAIALAKTGTNASTNNASGSSERAVAVAPSYQISDAQKAFQDGVGAVRVGNHVQAIESFKVAANLGYAPAQGALGYHYEKGVGVPANPGEAASWYRKAADQGSPNAQVSLGSLYERGRGVAQSDTEAFAYYAKADQKGYPRGTLAMASMFETGKGVTKDTAKAFELRKKVADQGVPAGQLALARSYAIGIGIEKNPTEAASLLRKAADAGEPAAQLTLGRQYMKGSSGMPHNPGEGIAWLNKAAAKNYPPALYELGSAHESGTGVGKDIETARDYYTKAASGGSKEGEVALARLKSAESTSLAANSGKSDKMDVEVCDRHASFENLPDRSIKKAYFGFIDVDQALTPCLVALKSDAGNSRLQAQLARIYFQQGKFVEGVALAKKSLKEQRISTVLLAYAHRHGLGGYSVNLPEAATLLRQGVDRGEPEAMADLSGYYAFGIGVPKDERKALELLQRASDNGELGATSSLATIRHQGRLGTAKDTDEAIRLMQKAADSGGLPSAQLRLGMILVEREKRVTPEAQRYFASARQELERFAQMGSANARALLGEIYEKGIGVAKDASKAVELYRASANHGNINGMTRLGTAYLNGVGIDKNSTEAKVWLEKAAAAGSETATKLLKEIPGG